jgi:hypothetical protein
MPDSTVPAPLRSVLICHKGSAIDAEGLSRWLASFSDLVGIVVLDEPARRTWQRVRAQLRRGGVLRMIDVLAFRAWYALRDRADDCRFERDAVGALRARFGDRHRSAAVLETRSVNAAETVAFLKACRPDFVVARCKTLLKPEVFGIPTGGTYVLHPGICPEYRNAHGCFWALAARDVDRVGLTVIRIDAGVDTGPIYGHFTYPFDERTESHVRIQWRVLLENLDGVRDRLLAAVAGTATPIDVSGRRSAAWGQPWLTAYWRWKRALRRAGERHESTAVPRRGAAV